MKYVKIVLASLAFTFMFVGPALTIAAPTPVSAACDDRLLGIPPWYRGLTTGTGEDCVVMNPQQAGGLTAFITKLALNIIEIGMVIVGYIALFFVIYGGFQFITGGDNPGQVEKARHTVLNAIIGLAISLSAIALLNVFFAITGQ